MLEEGGGGERRLCVRLGEWLGRPGIPKKAAVRPLVITKGLALTNSKEEWAGEDGRPQSHAGDKHGQHAGTEHQLLRERRDDLVTEPAHVGQTEHPEAGVWGGGAGACYCHPTHNTLLQQAWMPTRLSPSLWA